MRILAFLALVNWLVAAPVLAEEYTDAQLLNLFQTQRDAFRAARASDLGQARGLTLVTVDNVNIDATTEVQGLAALDSSADGAGVSISGVQDATTTADLLPLTQPEGLDQVDTVALTGKAPNPDLTDTAPTLADATPEQDRLIVAGQTDTVPALSSETPTLVAAAEGPNEPLVFGRLDPQLQVNLFIRFAFDSAALSDDQRPKLDQMCGVMQNSDVNLFRIVGHTDTSGTDEYNQRLSQLRAQEVGRYLVACGIAPERLETVGMGERFPINTNDPRAEENRRVEFQALS